MWSVIGMELVVRTDVRLPGANRNQLRRCGSCGHREGYPGLTIDSSQKGPVSA